MFVWGLGDRMRLLSVALLLLVSACQRPSDPHVAQMDDIEAKIELPRGSLPFDQYARYYSAGPNGLVLAVYQDLDASGLRLVQDHCQRTQSREMPCAGEGKLGLVGAGQRKWVNDWRDIPALHGGGCGEVAFAYDPKRQVFSPPECNGPN